MPAVHVLLVGLHPMTDPNSGGGGCIHVGRRVHRSQRECRWLSGQWWLPSVPTLLLPVVFHSIPAAWVVPHLERAQSC